MAKLSNRQSWHSPASVKFCQVKVLWFTILLVIKINDSGEYVVTPKVLGLTLELIEPRIPINTVRFARKWAIVQLSCSIRYHPRPKMERFQVRVPTISPGRVEERRLLFCMCKLGRQL